MRSGALTLLAGTTGVASAQSAEGQSFGFICASDPHRSPAGATTGAITACVSRTALVLEPAPLLAYQPLAKAGQRAVYRPAPARASSGSSPIHRSRLYISSAAGSSTAVGGRGTNTTGIAGSWPSGNVLSDGPAPT